MASRNQATHRARHTAFCQPVRNNSVSHIIYYVFLKEEGDFDDRRLVTDRGAGSMGLQQIQGLRWRQSRTAQTDGQSEKIRFTAETSSSDFPARSKNADSFDSKCGRGAIIAYIDIFFLFTCLYSYLVFYFLKLCRSIISRWADRNVKGRTGSCWFFSISKWNMDSPKEGLT